jgi:uncharacterized protein (TIGR03382 family)
MSCPDGTSATLVTKKTASGCSSTPDSISWLAAAALGVLVRERRRARVMRS